MAMRSDFASNVADIVLVPKGFPLLIYEQELTKTKTKKKPQNIYAINLR